MATIAAVEQETGLSKDTLRVWERRYGFPQPLRDTQDERLYPAEQVERLRLIRRLMDLGHRPGKVVGAPLRELSALAAGDAAAATDVPEHLRELMALIEAGDAALQPALSRELMRLGLLRFATDVIGPLNVLVGEAWARGRIAVWHEHLYSEHVQSALREGITALRPVAAAPRVLLTTVPGEGHQLGLLLAQACLVLEGAHCIALGLQTPLRDICGAAAAHAVDVVALSYSEAQRTQAARASVAELRRLLDRRIGIWAGGRLWGRQRRPLPGVQLLAELDAIPGAVAAWRAQHDAAGARRAAASERVRRGPR